MEFRPYPYQQHAISAIEAHESFGLFLDMGLGKTVITLTAINDLIYDSFEVQKVLIIAPKRVAESTWQDEGRKWDHLKGLRFSAIIGTRAQRMKALDSDADVYIIGRDNVAWLCDLYNLKHQRLPFDMLVVDESSSFKNPGAVRFKKLRKNLGYFRKRVILTGTPTSNTLMDLWSQLYILDMGERLGKTLTSYRENYFKPGRRNGFVVYNWVPAHGAEDAIYEKIRDVCMSMKAKDYITLPNKISNIVKVSLPQTAVDAYTQMMRDQVLAMGEPDQITALQAASVSNKLQQIANGSVYTDDQKVKHIHDAKVEALQEIIEGSGGQPVLVFYSFRHDVGNIKAVIPEAEEFSDKGDTLRRWNEGKIPVLLAHPASVGYGLNMQDGGHIVVWYGLTWSLEAYEQANARLYRQGQDMPVIIHHIIAKDTVDETIMNALRNKKKGQDALMEAVKAMVKNEIKP